MLAGPASPDTDGWQQAVRSALVNVRTLSFDLKEQPPVPSRELFASPPGWAEELYHRSAADCGSVSSAFSASIADCRRARCQDRPLSDPFDHVDRVARGDYSITQLQRTRLFRPIIPSRLALPANDFKLVDIRDFLPWPFDQLFSDAGIRRLNSEVAAQRQVTAKVHLARAGHEAYAELLLRLAGPGLVEFRTDEEMQQEFGEGWQDLPVNGCFGLEKDELWDRFILNCTPGNALHAGMLALQREYSRLLRENPERARELRLSARLMDIPTPDCLIRLGVGAVAKSESDFSNFFYQFLCPRGFRRAQLLPRILAHLVGVDAAGTVTPVFVSLAMGHWAAALAAHVAHTTLVRRTADRALYWRAPCAVSPDHGRMVAEARACAVDGTVALADVPRPLLASLAAQFSVDLDRLPGPWLAGFRVPVAALQLQPSPRDAASVATRSLLLCDAGTGRDQPVDLPDGADLYDVVTSCYIDDNHGFVYPPPASGAAGIGLAKPVGDALRLGFSMLAASKGILQNVTKLKWTSSRTTPTTGVDIEFVLDDPSWPLRLSVGPERRAVTDAVIRGILAGGTHVDPFLLAHVRSRRVWETLPRRSMLSAMTAVFDEDPALKGAAPVPVWLSPRLRRELRLLTMISPTLSSLTRPYSDTVFLFDASGRSDLGWGGYGVVRRSGLDAELAAEITEAVRGTATPSTRPPTALPCFVIGDDFEPPSASRRSRAVTDFLLQDWEVRFPDWRVVAHGAFRSDPGPINCAEAATGALAAAIAARARSARGRRVLIGGDNLASLHAFHKGRSSSWRLNRACQKVAARCYFGGFDVKWFYVPSKANAADQPSRRWYRNPFLRQVSHLGVEFSDNDAGDGPPSVRRPRQPRRAGPRHRYKGPPVVVRDIPARGLTDHSISAKQYGRYKSVWEGFKYFYNDHGQGPLADALEGYVRAAWAEGFTTKGDCKTLLSAVTYFAPEAKAFNTTARAWRAIKGWDKEVPVESHNPVSLEVLALCVCILAWDGHTEAAVALLLSFHTYGRHHEIADLRRADVAIDGDPRLLPGTAATVLFTDPKAGRPQAVTVDDQLVIDVLRFQMARTADDPDGWLFPRLHSRADDLLDLFKLAQRKAGFEEPPYVVHSCRHGGPVHDKATGRRDVPEMAIRGRWASEKTLRNYLNSARAMYMAASYPPRVRQLLQTMRDSGLAMRLALGV